MTSPPPAPHPSALSTSLDIDRVRILDTLMSNLQGMAYRCRVDERWTMLFVSPGCLDLSGYAPDRLLSGGDIDWEQITHPEDRVWVREAVMQQVRRGTRFHLEYRIVTRSGDIRWVLERGVAVRDEAGHMVLEGFLQDVSDQHATREALQQAEARFRHIFENATEGIFRTTPEGRYVAANPALARLYGYESPEALMADMDDIEHRLYVDPDRRRAFRELMDDHGEVVSFESEVFRRDGTRIWISENAHPVKSPAGRLLYYEGTVLDITERRRYQIELERQANHDGLTGLPNRSLLTDRAQQAIARAQRQHRLVALVFVDLDNFKYVNDALGHAAGDELLVQMARRLQASVRGSDTVARYGGDEFVLLLNEHADISTVIHTLDRVLETVRQPVLVGTRELQVRASLGVALCPQDGTDAGSLLKHADSAMYAAKAQGRNNYQFFIPRLNEAASERLTLEDELRRALERGDLSIHLQPKVNVQGRITGAEALARWHHADMGWIAPDRFVPIAEESGLIGPLTDRVLMLACSAASGWPRSAGAGLSVAVNLSPRLFLGGDLVEKVDAALRRTGLPPSRLELELTENVLLGDGDRVRRALEQFRARGIRLAMDDFGTGYSSLSYLRKFPLDAIKLDRSLVQGVENDPDVAMIASAALTLGHSLRKSVVAEGVENPAQFDFLRRHGCLEFQGYLFSRPLAADAFAELLLQRNVHSMQQ